MTVGPCGVSDQPKNDPFRRGKSPRTLVEVLFAGFTFAGVWWHPHWHSTSTPIICCSLKVKRSVNHRVPVDRDKCFYHEEEVGTKFCHLLGITRRCHCDYCHRSVQACQEDLVGNSGSSHYGTASRRVIDQ